MIVVHVRIRRLDRVVRRDLGHGAILFRFARSQVASGGCPVGFPAVHPTRAIAVSVKASRGQAEDGRRGSRCCRRPKRLGSDVTILRWARPSMLCAALEGMP